MSDIQYYKGVHKVRVLTKSEGYWVVEALEVFEDTVNEKKVPVKPGERRIVPVEDVYKQKTLPPMVAEHAYELRMEKKLKQIVAEKEVKTERQKKSRAS